MKKNDEMLMNKSEKIMLRWIQCVSMIDHVRNDENRKAHNNTPATDYGHVRRRDDSDTTRTVMDMDVEGVIPR